MTCKTIPINESDSSDDVDEALEIVEEILEFVDSVAKQVADIAESIENTDRVTKRQLEALHNMRDGCRRWLEK